MDPYSNSTAIAKLHRAQKKSSPLRLAFLDVDGTCTGTADNQAAWRAGLEDNNFIVIFITNRSLELCLSWSAWDKSSPAVQNYPKPDFNPGLEDNQRGLSDPDIAAGRTGNVIGVKQMDGGYAIDNQLDYPASSLSETWPARKREAADHIFNSLLHELNTPASSFYVLLAGDSEPDLPMGFLSCAGSQATFIIPGGAPVREQLFSPPLAHKYPLTKQDPGLYKYTPAQRTVIVGDETFPGTIGVETMLSWLKSGLIS